MKYLVTKSRVEYLKVEFMVEADSQEEAEELADEVDDHEDYELVNADEDIVSVEVM